MPKILKNEPFSYAWALLPAEPDQKVIWKIFSMKL